MLRFVFVGVFAFAAGFAVRDQAQYHTAEAQDCREERERATEYAAAVANVLNGGGIETNDVRASCRITRKETS